MSKPISSNDLLSVALLVSVLAAAGLFIYYESTLQSLASLQKNAQELQQEAVSANNDRTLVQALVIDALEYGRHHTNLQTVLARHVPLIQFVGIRPKAPAIPVSTPTPALP
jgi:hypothetical protein